METICSRRLPKSFNGSRALAKISEVQAEADEKSKSNRERQRKPSVAPKTDNPAAVTF
jgi:hypothetical protein